ncbi:MAG TPA: hypothetical protein VN941_05495 [Bradyrhizobium sp.]|nr:hypothetical protein [Bradyrhizobium sp.]
MKIFEISVHASESQDDNRRVFSKPFRRYKVVADSEAVARTMVEADLGDLSYKVIDSIDKGFTLSEGTAHLELLPSNV